MSECSICCESFNKSTRCKIDCKTCNNEGIIACQSCAKRYILEQPTDPSCMICKIEWDAEFLINNFTKIFVNKTLKVHRENYLLEKQMAMLPETQSYAEHLKLIEGLEKQKLNIKREKVNLELKIKRMNLDIKNLEETISDIRNGNSQEKHKLEFTYKCTIENCNGFLNGKFECGICENKICKHCMEIKNEGHECNEDKKETIKLIRQDTKPCPKCGQLIHKLPNGCDQMYCIKCHTAFSWKTGQLERGTIHNPEYYRWMRENGKNIPRNPLDAQPNQCGNNIISYHALLDHLRIYFPLKTLNARRFDDINTIKILNMHRMFHHINHINVMYNNDIRLEESELRYMRAHFILNKITKDEFKKKLQMTEKKKNKNKKLNDIWNLLRLVILEYIGKISENLHELKEGYDIINEIVVESEKIRKYCNDSFINIGKMFSMVYPGISGEWIQISNFKIYTEKKK